MSTDRTRLIGFEQLESRIVPAVDRALGTFEITDTSANPNHSWASPYTDYSNTVPDNDNLVATQLATYRFSKGELAAVRAAGGLKLTESLWWRDRGIFDDTTIKRATVSHTFVADGTTVIYAPPNFNTTNGEWTDDDLISTEGTTIEHYGWLNDPDSLANYKSRELWMTNGAIGLGVARGARAGTAGVGYAMNLKFADPSLPPLPGGTENHRIYAFHSNDGIDFQVTAANATGYSLLAASSSALVVDSTGNDLIVDPATGFTSAYHNGTAGQGVWGGAGPAASWVIANASTGAKSYLTGTMESQVPAGLASIFNGQTGTVSGSSIAAGTGALWLFFETEGETVGFLITAGANSVPVATADTFTTTEDTHSSATSSVTIPMRTAMPSRRRLPAAQSTGLSRSTRMAPSPTTPWQITTDPTRSPIKSATATAEPRRAPSASQ